MKFREENMALIGNSDRLLPMHELGIAEAALRQVAAQAREAGATHVHRIVLRIGTLSGVDPDALRFAMEVVLPESPAAGATFEIEIVPARARCQSCASEFVPADGFLFECPHCHALGATILQGKELDLVSLEIS
jgi:hydrogenase nickel incorporation protein HypA/HybF